MGKYIIEGVTIKDLSLTAIGAGPGCASAIIDPDIEEEKLEKTRMISTEKFLLKNIKVKIKCPGTGGASQSNCNAASVQVKAEKKYKDNGNFPISENDVCIGGSCSGTYPVGNSTSSCSCTFTVTISKSAQEKMGV